MNRTAIVTDSNSGITQAEAKKLGITVLPMPFFINEELFFEEVTLSQDEFYRHLEEDSNISTSQPAPGNVTDLWDKLLQDYETIVHIPMSSGLSNSCETALGLANDYEGKVAVVDNHRISITLKASVIEAKQMADSGMSAKEIKQDLEARAYDSSIYIAVDTLTYLKKGGRVTPAGAALGTVLNIKPVLTIQGGKLDAFAKIRGMKKCRIRMVDAIVDDYKTRFNGADLSRVRVDAAGAGLTPEEIAEWKSLISQAFPGVDVQYDLLSLSVSAHIGPGTYGIGISIVRS